MEAYQMTAGFGLADITPQESVPMTSYGDDLRRFSLGNITDLQARALALSDEAGQTILIVTGDLSWAPSYLGEDILEGITQTVKVPKDHIFLMGTHTHDSVGCHFPEIPAVMRYRERYINGMITAAVQAWHDRKPAKIFVGSAITERMNFVKRYVMDDGSFCGDLFKGTGTRVVGHESQADPELQLMRFCREGCKDILIANFQTHPHLEGKNQKVSAQLAGSFREETEARLGVHCIYWNGGAGNINSGSRIKAEQRAFDRFEWARIMVDYAEKVRLHPVRGGPVRVSHGILSAPVNHDFDGNLDNAQKIVDFYQAGHSIREAMEFAEPLGFHSSFHASRAIANAKLPQTKDMLLQTYSFGDVAGVVLPYELFDTTCMYIKRNSAFGKTFINGYSWPSYVGYIPSAMGFADGGYEVDNCTFAPGTAEKIAETFLDLLEAMKD